MAASIYDDCKLIMYAEDSVIFYAHIDHFCTKTGECS